MVRASTCFNCDGIVSLGLSSFHSIKGIVVSETAAAMGDTAGGATARSAATACTAAAAAAGTGCTITAADTVLKHETVRAVTGCSSPSHWRLLI